ncbi:MAG: hypothetical protein Q4D02_06235 [Clostridia bacterium]|nr:hypothetical protein [Clostridia bacterium]
MKWNGFKIVKQYKETKDVALIVYFVLRILVIFCMILQIINGDLNNAFMCLFSLILFTIPGFIEKKFKIELPSLLESIIYIFIFAAEILGSINNFYGNVPHLDTILHTLNGFLAAGIGFSLVDLLNTKVKNVNLSPFFVTVVAFCFSMTIGVLWEFGEYGVDVLFDHDSQKDKIVTKVASVKFNPEDKNEAALIDHIVRTEIYTEDGKVYLIDGGYLDIGINDTMKDLIVNFIGAICFSIIGYLYIKNRDKYRFAKNFIPVKNE